MLSLLLLLLPEEFELEFEDFLDENLDLNVLAPDTTVPGGAGLFLNLPPKASAPLSSWITCSSVACFWTPPVRTGSAEITGAGVVHRDCFPDYVSNLLLFVELLLELSQHAGLALQVRVFCSFFVSLAYSPEMPLCLATWSSEMRGLPISDLGRPRTSSSLCQSPTETMAGVGASSRAIWRSGLPE